MAGLTSSAMSAMSAMSELSLTDVDLASSMHSDISARRLSTQGRPIGKHQRASLAAVAQDETVWTQHCVSEISGFQLPSLIGFLLLCFGFNLFVFWATPSSVKGLLLPGDLRDLL